MKQNRPIKLDDKFTFPEKAYFDRSDMSQIGKKRDYCESLLEIRVLFETLFLWNASMYSVT